MHVSLERKSNESALGREENFLHYIAREGRVMLRWMVGICIVAIVLCMVSPGFFFVAVVPAILLLIAYVLLLVTHEVERRSDPEAHRYLEQAETALVVEDVVENHEDDNQLEPGDAAIVKRESRTGVLIIGAVLVTAILIAAILFNWKMIAIGAMVLFAYMLLIAAPFWLGWFNDDIEITTKRMIGEPESARARTGEVS